MKKFNQLKDLNFLATIVGSVFLFFFFLFMVLLFSLKGNIYVNNFTSNAKSLGRAVIAFGVLVIMSGLATGLIDLILVSKLLVMRFKIINKELKNKALVYGVLMVIFTIFVNYLLYKFFNELTSNPNNIEHKENVEHVLVEETNNKENETNEAVVVEVKEEVIADIANQVEANQTPSEK